MARRHRRHSAQAPELDITAFLNLMVVLIPFLLLSAAFSQLSVFELYLPSSGEVQSKVEQLDQQPELEVIILEQRLIVNDRNSTVLAELPELEDAKLDIAGLQRVLVIVKGQYSELTQITILAQTHTPYRQIIEVMDGVRAIVVTQGADVSLRELFPDIALGDAPILSQTPVEEAQ